MKMVGISSFKSLPKDSYKVMVDVVDKADVESPNTDSCHSTLGEVRYGLFLTWHMSL